MNDDPRYPVGKFQKVTGADMDQRRAWIREIAAIPAQLAEAVRGLSEARLNEPYREGGWTLREVAHHLPDSHLNAYIRTKLALTEDAPTIKPYDEAAWARLEDVSRTPVEVSVRLLHALHERWATLLESLKEEDYARTFTHPEHGAQTLDWLVQLYAWHGRHHVAHITGTRAAKGW